MHRLLNGIRGLLNAFQPKRNSTLALDISPTAIKMLELSRRDDFFCVESYGYEPLFPHALEEYSNAAATSIKTLFNRLQPNSRQVIIAVPDAVTITKIISINQVSHERDLEELVYFEADKHIPYPIQEISLDFQVLGGATKDASHLDVLIAASRTENIIQRVDLVTQAGLDVVVVDVESYAVERAAVQLCKDLPVSKQDTLLIIDVEATCIRLFAFQQGKLIYSREEQSDDIPFNGQNSALFTANIAAQIKRAMNFFYSVCPEYQVVHSLLAGSLARLPGLLQVMQKNFGIHTVIANPFTHMLVKKTADWDAVHHDAPALLVACGLALRNITRHHDSN